MLDCVSCHAPRRLKELQENIEETFLLEKIEELQFDPDPDLTAIASRIYDRFFSHTSRGLRDDDDDDEQDQEDENEDDDDDDEGGDDDPWSMGDVETKDRGVPLADSLPDIPRSHSIEDQSEGHETFNF